MSKQDEQVNVASASEAETASTTESMDRSEIILDYIDELDGNEVVTLAHLVAGLDPLEITEDGFRYTEDERKLIEQVTSVVTGADDED